MAHRELLSDFGLYLYERAPLDFTGHNRGTSQRNPMAESSSRASWPGRVAVVISGLIGFLLLFVIALRITETEMYPGIESSRATGLAAAPWDGRNMWSSAPMLQKPAELAGAAPWESSIARSAALRTRFRPSTVRSPNSIKPSPLVRVISRICASALVLGVLFAFGLPLFFWAILLFWPMRTVLRRLRHSDASITLPAAP